MKKLLSFALGAAVMEVLAMNVKIMHLPPSSSRYFGTIAALLVLFALIEKPRPDERDRMLTWQSSHIAFLTVAAVLTGILIYQTISGIVEPWTITAILALVVGKIAGRIISQKNS